MLCPSVVGIKNLGTHIHGQVAVCLHLGLCADNVSILAMRDITDLAIFENIFLLLYRSGSLHAFERSITPPVVFVPAPDIPINA